MSGVYSDLPYMICQHKDLDKEWTKYRRVRVFNGDAWRAALTQKEEDILLRIWRKKRLNEWTLTFREVSTWVELAGKIIEYRKNVQRENARLRKYRSRERLKAAARKGDKVAKERIKAIKKSNSDNMSNMRRKKKEASRSA